MLAVRSVSEAISVCVLASRVWVRSASSVNKSISWDGEVDGLESRVSDLRTGPVPFTPAVSAMDPRTGSISLDNLIGSGSSQGGVDDVSGGGSGSVSGEVGGIDDGGDGDGAFDFFGDALASATLPGGPQGGARRAARGSGGRRFASPIFTSDSERSDYHSDSEDREQHVQLRSVVQFDDRAGADGDMEGVDADTWRVGPEVISAPRDALHPSKYTKFHRQLLAAVDAHDLDGTMLLYEAHRAARGGASDFITYYVVLDACARARRMDVASSVLEDMAEANIALDATHFTALVKGAAFSGSLSAAEELVEKAREVGITPNEHMYAALISAAMNSGDFRRGFDHFNRMKRSKVQPNEEMFKIMFGALFAAGALEDCYYVFKSMSGAHLFKGSSELYSMILKGFSEHDSAEDVKMVYEHTSTFKSGRVFPSAEAYTAMFNRYATNGLYDAARALVPDMKSAGHFSSGALDARKVGDVVKSFPGETTDAVLVALGDAEVVNKAAAHEDGGFDVPAELEGLAGSRA